MVAWVIFNTPSQGRTEKPGAVTAAQVRGALMVMVLLGVTWIFGALALGPGRVVFAYVFCIANSMQGFLIFTLRCLQHAEARASWRHLLTSCRLRRAEQHGGETSSSQAPSRSSSSAYEKMRKGSTNTTVLFNAWRHGLKEKSPKTENGEPRLVKMTEKPEIV